MPAKSILTSKTFWFNTLTTAVEVTTLLTGTLPPKYAPHIVMVQGVANILLRLISKTPVTLTGK